MLRYRERRARHDLGEPGGARQREPRSACASTARRAGSNGRRRTRTTSGSRRSASRSGSSPAAAPAPARRPARVTRVPPGHPEGYLEGFANIYAEAARAIRAARDGKKLPTGRGLPDGRGRREGRRLRRGLRQVEQAQRRLGDALVVRRRDRRDAPDEAPSIRRGSRSAFRKLLAMEHRGTPICSLANRRGNRSETALLAAGCSGTRAAHRSSTGSTSSGGSCR